MCSIMFMIRVYLNIPKLTKQAKTDSGPEILGPPKTSNIGTSPKNKSVQDQRPYYGRFSEVEHEDPPAKKAEKPTLLFSPSWDHGPV